ncbi:hypothetical protein [Mycolicibacterium vaccae]|uniref:Uncharacterized protein n=1 Tax=Mycolicibacterium vaccae ATCC 25954 TaxID=1194972 RepID=K0V3V9_MYCVA|nr:hypothetical protein [Mycolicibacterium vaccae]ANI37695.1 hypothetical protein MYVA_0427 [Mycolicibacterium vaccae 95051]EJZ09483.1 hypothetical protein MVAC_12456 [Mycolicibacterium vaccae ATCC 25954]
MPTRLKEIPYDHVAVFTLAGRRGARIEDVINVSVDGVFVATSIGYSFVPAEPAGPVVFSMPDVNQLLTGLFNDPRVGLRALAARVFGIDFTYSIIDSGTGRELQNRSIHNTAGLGGPDGRRPFRPMAKPMLFQPRSTIRVVVDEISDGPLYQGAQLFIALHGYKILGAGI